MCSRSGREMRYDIYDLLLLLPRPLCERTLRFEVDGAPRRVGEVVTPLRARSRAGIRAAYRGTPDRGGRDLPAACYRQSAARAADPSTGSPRIAVRTSPSRLSSAVAPEIREYERMSTTVANAYVQPLAERYLLTTRSRTARSAASRRQLYLMLSSGGITIGRHCRPLSDPPGRSPARPPACWRHCSYGERDRRDADLVSFDMGGTTAKLCLIRDGRRP